MRTLRYIGFEQGDDRNPEEMNVLTTKESGVLQYGQTVLLILRCFILLARLPKKEIIVLNRFQ